MIRFSQDYDATILTKNGFQSFHKNNWRSFK